MKIGIFKIALLFDLVITNLASAQTWLSSNLSTNANFNAIASSADGTKLFAAGGAGGDYIYISTNSGFIWTKTTAANAQWSSIASSADGTKLAAAAYGGLLYSSTNSGNTWSSYNAAIGMNSPVQNWSYVASSADGMVLMAVATGSGIFSSTNSGKSWFTNNVPFTTWSGITCSADGTRLAALTSADDPGVYTSTNTGLNWEKSTFIGQPKGALAASSDSSKLMVLTAYEIYLSTNWGITWTTNNRPFYFNAPCAYSAELNKLWVMGGMAYQTYFSTNYGITWTTNNLPSANWNTENNVTWQFAASADGNNLVTAGEAGGIWVSQTIPSPQLNLTFSNTNFLLSWLVPSTNFALQENSDLIAANWTTLTNPPTLNPSNLQEQIWLPVTNSSGYFRLVTQ